MKLLGKFKCWWTDAHVWRVRRKAEPINTKTCARCGAMALVKPRKSA